MLCEFCGGQTVQRKVRKQHWFRKKLYLIENVPTEVCQECGERYFHAKVLDEIDRMLAQEYLVKERIQVEVVNFQDVALI